MAQTLTGTADGLRRRQLGVTLGAFRTGRSDPTTKVGVAEWWRATRTPEGSATLRLRWPDGVVVAEAWGDGADWIRRAVPGLTGALDRPRPFLDGHPKVLRAQHNHPHLRLGASGMLYHELLPVILAQRITGAEAMMQWHHLVRAFAERAPGPRDDLFLPPDPAALAARPAWWFHPLGIEAKRAEALRTVARHAARLAEWSTLEPVECAAKLALLRGIGIWTINSALALVLGDPDAVAVGDYHLKNVVAHALAGEPRGTDERMLELLAPYAGQRGRVIRLLLLDGHSAPKFGPRQRILPMRRW